MKDLKTIIDIKGVIVDIDNKEITNAYEEALFIMEKTIERKIHSA